MSYRKVLLFFCMFLMLGGCGTTTVCNRDPAQPLPGTSTAIIGVSLNKDGMPAVRDTEVIVKPGQKILFAGPDEFAIVFKDRKSPNGKIENSSSNGVVVINVPNNIFDKKEFLEEYRKNKELRFSYGVRVGDKELDPTVIVKREN